MQEFKSVLSSQRNSHSGACWIQLTGVGLLFTVVTVTKFLQMKPPRSRISVTLPPNTKQKGEKLDLVTNCFVPLRGFIVHCLWQRVSLFSEAPVEEVSGRLEDMWLLWMNEPAWVTGLGKRRPADDRHCVLFPLSLGSCVTYIHFKDTDWVSFNRVRQHC